MKTSHLFALLFLHAVFMYQSCVQPHLHHMLLCPHLHVQLCSLHPLQMVPFPHVGLSPLRGIMLTCPSREPSLVIAFNTHVPHSLPGAYYILCQDVSASTSCVTALSQFIAAEKKRQHKNMQMSEHARYSLNDGVRSGTLCTALLVSRSKELYFLKERARESTSISHFNAGIDL